MLILSLMVNVCLWLSISNTGVCAPGLDSSASKEPPRRCVIAAPEPRQSFDKAVTSLKSARQRFARVEPQPMDDNLRSVLDRVPVAKEHFRPNPQVGSPNVHSIVIEVGTNTRPEFLMPVHDNLQQSMYFLGLEPAVFDAARKVCETTSPNKCTMLPFAIGTVNEVKAFHISSTCKECSSLLDIPSDAPKNEGAAPDGKKDTNTVTTTEVVVITLDTLFHHIVPSNVDVRLLSLDMQGFDLHGLSSLRNPSYRSRVANVFIECQDLPIGHPKMLHASGSATCGQAVDCVKKHWPGWAFVGCWANLAVREFNCVFRNTQHPLAMMGDRPLFNYFSEKITALEYGADCPSFFNEQRDERKAPVYPPTPLLTDAPLEGAA